MARETALLLSEGPRQAETQDQAGDEAAYMRCVVDTGPQRAVDQIEEHEGQRADPMNTNDCVG